MTEPKFGRHVIDQSTVNGRSGTCSTCGPIDLANDGTCAERKRIAAKYYNKLDPVGKAAYQKQYGIDNKDRLREYKKAHWHLQMYGLSRERFLEILASQNNRCAICGTTDPGKAWQLDHNHRLNPKDPNGHRGILCHRCNIALGMFCDNVDYLQAAISYLARQKEAAG